MIKFTLTGEMMECILFNTFCSKFKFALIFGFLPTSANKLIKAKWLETTDAKVNGILYLLLKSQ